MPPRPPPCPPYPRIIAHRGGGALAPENTLAGIRIAHRLGCRGVEFDVMLTADGVPILMHDDTLERTTDGAGPVAAMMAAALARLDAGGKHHPAFAVSPPPTFAQALRLCGELGLWLNAEIKPTPGTDAATGRAVAAVAELAAAHWKKNPAQSSAQNLAQNSPQHPAPPPALVLSSFSPAALQAAMATAPAIPRALLLGEAPADWRALLDSCGASALHVAAGVATADPAALRTLCASGLPVACYTVNDREIAAALFAAGVTAIFTDRPDLWLPGEM